MDRSRTVAISTVRPLGTVLPHENCVSSIYSDAMAPWPGRSFPPTPSHLRPAVRLCVEVTGTAVTVMYGMALFFKDPDTFLQVTAILVPLFAAVIAVMGVAMTLRENRAGRWWVRSQWVIQLLVETENEEQFGRLAPVIQHILVVDPPSAEQKQLVHDVLQSTSARLWGDASKSYERVELHHPDTLSRR